MLQFGHFAVSTPASPQQAVHIVCNRPEVVQRNVGRKHELAVCNRAFRPCFLPVDGPCTATQMLYGGPLASRELEERTFATRVRSLGFACKLQHVSCGRGCSPQDMPPSDLSGHTHRAFCAAAGGTLACGLSNGSGCSSGVLQRRNRRAGTLVIGCCMLQLQCTAYRSSVHPPRWCCCKAQEPRTAADGSSDDAGGSVETSSRAVAKAPVDPARAAARVAEEAQVAQGQRTAVITGAVSIVFGVRQLHYVLEHSGVCQLNSGAVTSWVAALHSARFGQCISVQKVCAYQRISLYKQPAPMGSPRVAYEVCRRADHHCAHDAQQASMLFVTLSGCSFVMGSQCAGRHVRTLTANHITKSGDSSPSCHAGVIPCSGAVPGLAWWRDAATTP